MPAYANIDPAVDGLGYGMGQRIETGIAQEAISFGYPVFGQPGVDDKVWGVHQDSVKITLSGNLVTSNIITTTINGTPVATTFATSDAATITAHVAAINANSTVQALGAAGVVATNPTTDVILLLAVGIDLVVTSVVTLGAGQATATYVNTEWLEFLGVAWFSNRGGKSYGAGNSKYNAQDAVNIMTLGEAWVPIDTSSGANKLAYIITAPGATQGKFTDVVGTNLNSQGHFRRNANSGRSVLGLRLAPTP